MEHQQTTWINVSFLSVFLSLQPFILQSTAERRKTDRGSESKAPQETDTLR